MDAAEEVKKYCIMTSRDGPRSAIELETGHTESIHTKREGPPCLEFGKLTVRPPDASSDANSPGFCQAARAQATAVAAEPFITAHAREPEPPAPDSTQTSIVLINGSTATALYRPHCSPKSAPPPPAVHTPPRAPSPSVVRACTRCAASVSPVGGRHHSSSRYGAAAWSHTRGGWEV